MATPEQVDRQIVNDEKMERRNMDTNILHRNKGNGNNKDFTPAPTNGWNIVSIRQHHGKNVEGNEALFITQTSVSERDFNSHKLSADERKIRRMKNKQAKLSRLRRGKRKHGRNVAR